MIQKKKQQHNKQRDSFRKRNSMNGYTSIKYLNCLHWKRDMRTYVLLRQMTSAALALAHPLYCSFVAGVWLDKHIRYSWGIHALTRPETSLEEKKSTQFLFKR